jgi:hypothetical protein
MRGFLLAVGSFFITAGRSFINTHLKFHPDFSMDLFGTP